MYLQLNLKIFYVLTTLHVYVLGMNLITNRGYLSILQHQLNVFFYSRAGMCLLRGTLLNILK